MVSCARRKLHARDKSTLTYVRSEVSRLDMRYLLVAMTRIIHLQRIGTAIAVAFALSSLAGVASGETIYRWRDGSDRWHFSNRRGQAPSHAEVAKLPALSIVKARPIAVDSSSVAEVPADSADLPAEPSFDSVECEPADPSLLIDAIESRLAALRPEGTRGTGLTLLVAGRPVSHGPNAVIDVFPESEGDETTLVARRPVSYGPNVVVEVAENDGDETAASDQAAVAYPAGGGCPETPPLERYAVTSPARASASGLCADYRRGFAEIDSALSRNENVVRAFQVAAARFDPSPEGDEIAARGANITLPPWLVETNSAQTAELTDEIEGFAEELTVARDEIDRAARANRCW
jgi:hypothetical protein